MKIFTDRGSSKWLSSPESSRALWIPRASRRASPASRRPCSRLSSFRSWSASRPSRFGRTRLCPSSWTAAASAAGRTCGTAGTKCAALPTASRLNLIVAISSSSAFSVQMLVRIPLIYFEYILTQMVPDFGSSSNSLINS